MVHETICLKEIHNADYQIMGDNILDTNWIIFCLFQFEITFKKPCNLQGRWTCTYFFTRGQIQSSGKPRELGFKVG